MMNVRFCSEEISLVIDPKINNWSSALANIIVSLLEISSDL